MMQFGCKQNTACADAAMCAPAACDARATSESMNIVLDTAMCAVSFFVSLSVLILAVVLRLFGLICLLALIIMSLLVWCKQGDAKSVHAECSRAA